MAASGRIRRRLALAIVLTALIPLLAAVWLAESTVRQTSARFFIPEVGSHLDKSLGVHREVIGAPALKTIVFFGLRGRPVGCGFGLQFSDVVTGRG